MKNDSVGIINFVHRAIFVFTSIVVCTPVLIPASVSAQETLEEIVVTARQREERLQDTPVAVTAFSEQQIEQKYVEDLRDLGRYAPNVTIGAIPGFRAASIAIRGVSTGDIPSSFDPAVTVVVDEFFMGEYETALLDPFDLQQIEILRGPQGTLFGKNTIGGAVLVTTKRPADEFGIEARIRVGNYGRTDVAVALDAPLSPGKVTSRIAVFSQNSDGYADNLSNGSELGGDDVLAARSRILFTPSENFDALLTWEIVRDESDTPPLIHTSTCGDEQGFYGGDAFCGLGRGGVGGVPLGNPFDVWLVDVSEFAPSITAGIPHALNGLSDPKGGHRADIDGLYLNMNWDIGPGVITSVTGFRSVETDQYNDYYGDVIPRYSTIRSVHRETTSQELRFASDPSDSFDYVIGAFYQVNDLDYRNSTGLGPQNSLTLDFLTIDGDGFQDTTSLGLFAEGTFHVTDRTSITAGARYSEEDKDFNLRPIGLPESDRVSPSKSWDNTTYRLIVDHRFSDAVMAYGSYSTGFKSGGFNEQATQVATALLNYGQEEADSFEIGVKTELPDGRLRLNLAAFTVDYEDLQLDAVIPVPDSDIGQESVLTNAGEATVSGFEAEVLWLVTDALMLDATLGLLDAEYDKFDCNLDGDVENGNEDCTVLTMKRVPDRTASAGVTFNHDAFGGGSGALNIGFTYTDLFYNDIFNTQASVHEDVSLWNASWTFRTADEKYRLSIYGRNLTDEQYQDSGLGVANIWSFSSYGAPLTYGVEFGIDL